FGTQSSPLFDSLTSPSTLKSVLAFSRPSSAWRLKLLSFTPPMSVTSPILKALAGWPPELPPQAMVRMSAAATTPRNLSCLCAILVAPFTREKAQPQLGANRSVARIVHLHYVTAGGVERLPR